MSLTADDLFNTHFFIGHFFRNDSDSDYDELSDGEISKLLIVTQTPVRPKKHEGFDRTGDFVSRVKLSQDLAQVINDGLVYYEEHQYESPDEQESWIAESKNKNVSIISQAEFDKIKPGSEARKTLNPAQPPPPPPLNTPAQGHMNSGKNGAPLNESTSKLRLNQPHFYPVTKEPTTPSQVKIYNNNNNI